VQDLIHDFAADPGVRLFAALLLLDFVLGVSAAVANGTFQFGWLPDFLRKDILLKAFPYFGVWAAVRLGGDIEIAGVGAIEETVNGLIVAALAASIVKSVADLRVEWTAPALVAHSDEPPPQP